MAASVLDLIFTLLSRILSFLAASPTQLLMTLMTFVVGVVALPAAGAVGAAARVASRVSAVGFTEVVEAGLVACCSGSGSAGSYSYTTSFLGFSVGSSVGFSAGVAVGLSVGFSVGSLPSSESSSSSLRVKASSGSDWLSPSAGPAPAASSSCVAWVAAGSAAGVAAARLASFRVVSFLSVPSLITISLSLSM